MINFFSLVTITHISHYLIFIIHSFLIITIFQSFMSPHSDSIEQYIYLHSQFIEHYSIYSKAAAEINEIYFHNVQ